MVSGCAVDGKDLVSFLECLCPFPDAPGPQDLNEDGTASVCTSCESRGGEGEGEGEEGGKSREEVGGEGSRTADSVSHKSIRW